MNNILFSIIIATFNCGDLIKDTLESIVKQDKNLYECIIIDGLSTDNTMDVIKEYGKKYSNIKYVSERDNGIYDAMNKGIDLASGEYIYFIGAGDQMCSDALINVSHNINQEDFIYGNVFLDFEGIKIKNKYRKSDLIYSAMNHQSIFYKKSIFDKVGKYDLKYKVIADNILNKLIFGRDDILKKYIDVDIAHYLGDGISQGYKFQNDFKSLNDMYKNIETAFGNKYLSSLYKEVYNFNGKKIIAWGNGGEYTNASKYKTFDIKYFVHSKVHEELFQGIKVKNRDSLLLENKNEMFVLVFSQKYYPEIRKWLEENSFQEFKNFMLVTKEIVQLLQYLEIW